MKFGPVPLAEAEGAIAAHSLRLKSGVIRKGTRLTADLIARLSAEAVAEVVAARLEPGDVHEDEAARRVAEALSGDERPPRRGRHRPLQSLRGSAPGFSSSTARRSTR